jgi:hypothetical protein
MPVVAPHEILLSINFMEFIFFAALLDPSMMRQVRRARLGVRLMRDDGE